MLTSRGLGIVLGDLASMGFDARWGVLGAHHAGAPHKRDRIWIVATHPDRQRGRTAEKRVTRGGDSAEPGHDGEAREVAHPAGQRLERAAREGLPGARGASVEPASRGQETLRHPDRDREPALPVDAEASGVPGDVADANSGGSETRPTIPGGESARTGAVDPGARRPFNAGGLCPGWDGAEPAMPVDAEASGVPGDVAHATSGRRNRRAPAREQELSPQAGPRISNGDSAERGAGRPFSWWLAEPDVGRVAHGVAARVDRLRAIGNGQVPQCAALAWETLTEPTDSPKEGRDEF